MSFKIYEPVPKKRQIKSEGQLFPPMDPCQELLPSTFLGLYQSWMKPGSSDAWFSDVQTNNLTVHLPREARAIQFYFHHGHILVQHTHAYHLKSAQCLSSPTGCTPSVSSEHPSVDIVLSIYFCRYINPYVYRLESLTNFTFESDSAPNLGMYDIQSLFAWFLRVRMQFCTHYRSTWSNCSYRA